MTERCSLWSALSAAACCFYRGSFMQVQVRGGPAPECLCVSVQQYVHVYAAWCVRKGVDLDYIISKYAFRSSCMRSGGRCMSHLQCVWYM